MSNKVPAIFLDRDGTLNVDHGYVHEIDNFEFIDGTIEALQALKKMGYALVLVTNQSGIARGMLLKTSLCSLRNGWIGRWRIVMLIWMASISVLICQMQQ